MKPDLCQQWIGMLAGELICDIFYSMSNIRLRVVSEVPARQTLEKMDAVLGVASSAACGMCMQMRSGYDLFERLARNMIGAAPEDREEVAEYATEMFNIVCGRFISELSVAMKCCGRFQPTVYERPPNVTDMENGMCNSIYFESDENDIAVFSWKPMMDG